MQTEGGVRK